MFAKLKQKIEDGGTDLTKELFLASQRIAGSGSPILSKRNLNDNTKVKHYGSNDSLASNNSAQNDISVSSPKELPGSLLGSPSMSSTPQTKEWGMQIKELTRSLREEIGKREKVERVLEKQQDLLVKRIEEKDEEWKERLVALSNENEQLNEKLNDSKSLIEKYSKNQDAVEEIESFQTQEISKLKHLLLVSQQQSITTNDVLKSKDAELESKCQLVTTLEKEIESLKEHLHLKEQKNLFDIDKDTSKQFQLLQEELVETNKQLIDEKNKNKKLEDEKDNLQRICDALTSENDSLKLNACVISDLESKIQHLEQQLKAKEFTNYQNDENENVKVVEINEDESNDKISDNVPSGNDHALNSKVESNRIDIQLDIPSTLDWKTCVDKLHETEAMLMKANEAEELTRKSCLHWETEASKYALERTNLAQLNGQLMSELALTKENFSKLQNDFELITEEVKQLNEDLGLAESEKQNLLVVLAEFKDSLKDAQHANNEASRLELLTLNLQEAITEKNKTIKLQQQQINDMKKALHRELRLQSTMDANSNDSNEKNGHQKQTISGYSSSISSSQRDRPASLSEKLDDVNFKYVKHVVLKFMTSADSEAQHLIKAIGVLLDFTNEEEQLVRQTLEWKVSWFGTKPQLNRIHIGNRTIVS